MCMLLISELQKIYANILLYKKNTVFLPAPVSSLVLFNNPEPFCSFCFLDGLPLFFRFMGTADDAFLCCMKKLIITEHGRMHSVNEA